MGPNFIIITLIILKKGTVLANGGSNPFHPVPSHNYRIMF